ncbi:MAG: EamA family transporter RarD [Alphaproteobacteria bacterium]|nr:MAG: EamA family transporter RarD [Alphaproteobacteria bacterium]
MRKPLSENMTGILLGAGAYLFWGFSVIYWKWLSYVGPVEVVTHRVIWATVILMIILWYRRRLKLALGLLKRPRNFMILLGSSALLAANWSIFVWAVMSDRILEASLGYYINPLLNVLLGFLLLGERMSRVQSAAIALAAAGVVGMLVISGMLPWASLVLATTFAFYGYLRKFAQFVAMDALFLEMMFAAPVCLVILTVLQVTGGAHVESYSALIWVMLIGAGVVTFVPLWGYGESVSRTSLTNVGLLQFIAPTTQFLLAVLAYSEPFTNGHLFAFGCIWAALAIYMGDLVWRERRPKAAPQSE